jgi:hypothetical protein
MSYTPIITIVGNVETFLGVGAANATVAVRLTNFGSDNPRVPGSCIIATPWVPVTLDGSGNFSFTPIGNDVITPANTYYEVKFAADTANTAFVVIPYQFTGSGTQDLSQIIPFNQFGGGGGPSVSNLVVKNPTALQTISGFGLSVPQIQDLTGPLLPHTAGGTDLGSAALPFANLYIGNAASNNTRIAGSVTASRVFTLPDANSNPVQPVSGATAHQWLTFIDSSGVQHTSQPSFSDLLGTLNIAQVPTITSAQVDSSIEIVAHKNIANGYAGLDGTAKIAATQLPSPSATTLGGVESIAAQPSKWVNSISTAGVPSLTQPFFGDIAGTLVAAQEPSTTVNAVTNDTNVHGSIAAQTLTLSWNGILGLARGGLNADLSATGGPSQVLKQTAGGAAITVGQLAFTDISGTASTSQIPNLSALKITSGQLALAQGGTGADLSATGGASQVLKQTSVGGAITVGQVAFSDISGTVAAAQLPNPTASTLGGIEAIGAVAHQWIDSISTSGVPHLSQPAFSDISGTVSAGQLPARTASINFTIDGGGSVPTTGIWGQISIPTGCTVTGWVLTADASGSAVIDVLRSTYAGFPTTTSIAGTDKPTLSSTQKNENLSISAWGSTALSAGDQLQVNLNSVTTCTRLNLTLIVTVP